MTATLTPPVVAGPVRVRRARGAGPWPVALGVLLLLAGWQLAGRAGLAGGFVLTPADAVAPLLEPATRPQYERAAAATFAAAANGLLLGGGLAVLCAVVADQLPAVRAHVERLAALANSAPWVALGPVVLLVAGREAGPVAIAALAVFFYVFVATAVGLAAAPRASHEWFSSLGAGRVRRLVSLQLPRCMPVLAGGLQLAAPAALAGAVYGEWYGAERGLGVQLLSAMRSARPEPLWASAVVIAGGGLVVYGLCALLEAVTRRRVGAGLAGHRPAAPRPHPLRSLAEVVVSVAVVLGAWQAWVVLGEVSPLVVPAPSRVLADVADDVPGYLAATGHTLVSAGTGLALGLVAGVLLGAACWASRLLAGIAVPAVVLMTATPLIALFPLLARVFGYSGGTVVVVTAVIVLLPGFVATRAGLQAALPGHLDLARSLGGGRRSAFTAVVLPSALPHLATGFRVAAGSAVVAAVVAESLIGTAGLGVDFTYAYALLQMPRAFGCALLVVAVSLLVFALAGQLERAVHARFSPTP